MKSLCVKSLAGAAILGALPLSIRAQLVDLGEATGYAINNAGQVVLSTGIYSDGTVTQLPALPGQTAPAMGAAINAAGQVAGSATTTMPNPQGGNFEFTVPIEFSNGTLTQLQQPTEYYNPIDGTYYFSSQAYATGISSSGEIVGYTSSPDTGPNDVFQGTDYGGFIYTNGKLGGSPPYMPAGINDSSQVTGVISVPIGIVGGAVKFDAYFYDGTLTDLGQGFGNAINNAGQVTGTLDKVTANPGGSTGTVTGSYAFLYSNGITTNLGTLPGASNGSGNAISSTGQVVGSSGGHAFFYNGSMNDLNTLISATDPLKPYVTLQSAVGINDGLLILVNGVDSRTNGVTHAYLYQASFITLAPAELQFTQAAGGTSEAQSVTVTNAGTAAIPIETAYVNGNFSLRLNDCGTSLEPGAQCRLAAVFVPKTAGIATGALTIPSAGAAYQVPLSGVAPIAATISASRSTASIGQPVTITWSSSPGSTCTAQGSTSFQGAIATSGSKSLTENAAGTNSYAINCTAPGVPAVSASASVQWNWLPVTTAISASPATITAGKSTTLTWKSSNTTGCTATGGGIDDNWAGTKATSGSQTVTEATALDASLVLTFGITCQSTVSGLSDKASTVVTENPAPTSSGGGGGGGALNPLTLVALAGMLALRRVRYRQAPQRNG